MTAGSLSIIAVSYANYYGLAGLGFHYFQALERTANGGSITFYGDAGSTFQQIENMSFTGKF